MNIVTERPTQAENRTRVQAGSCGSLQADAYLACPFAIGAFAATLNYNRHDAVDSDGNGVCEYTGYDRQLAGLSLFLDDVGGFELESRLDLVGERRRGGAIGDDCGAIKANRSGTPSTNLSHALSHADDRLAVTGSLNHNLIRNFALRDSGVADALTGEPITVFTSAAEAVTVQGADVNLSYLVTPALTVSAAAEFFNDGFPPGAMVFARPKAKAYRTAHRVWSECSCLSDIEKLPHAALDSSEDSPEGQQQQSRHLAGS